jgi:hypothetical protein
MARKQRRRGKGLGTVYRRGQLWSIAWVAKGVKQYEHGFPDEEEADLLRADVPLVAQEMLRIVLPA